ncbi:hypothetical protein M8818_007414 [Zalaria obscura]|uniref:Uncharacterized protein n=1 Tax=Zalaria obscura TaxID=2024903 RepID=A0ACC3S482_9PEZI
MASADSTRPPPRRKSCGECVKAKRRCDQRLPTCLRCTKKGLHCEYVARPDRSNDFLQQMQFDLTTESLPAPFPEPIEDFSNPSTFDLATDIDLTAPLDLSWLPEVSLVEQESTLNNMNWVFETPKEMALAAPSMGRGGECCITGASEYAIETYDKICSSFQFDDFGDASTRLGYCVASFKRYPHILAKDASVAFWHKHLWRNDTPPIITDVFTTSVLYANRTPATERFVFRILEKHAKHVVDTCSSDTDNPREALARVHALLIYQIIRLFDGDVRQRNQAELAMPTLVAWNLHLRKLRDEMNPHGENGLLNPPTNWEKWVLAESIRRTVMLTCSFTGLYDLMKDDERHLWEAPSSFDFYRAWREKPKWAISNLFFEEFLKDGKGEDMDEFSRFLLVVYMGLDETRQWYYNTGSEF